MSKEAQAGLILKMYDLRREETMRVARDWFFREFNPATLDDFQAAMFGPHSGHLRMVISYWDMYAALVLHDAIDANLFRDCNGEHIGVFSKIEPILKDVQQAYTPRFAANLEKLIDQTPDGRQQTAAQRERMKAIMEKMAKSK